MKTVNIHEAKTQLSRLIAAAVAGEPFIIAKAGKPLVRVEALQDDPAAPSRLGFLSDMAVPDGFDQMGADDVGADDTP
jgi:antitoxin (DNA-binding transcriptional repressor) of toxin-antitoxin stability system